MWPMGPELVGLPVSSVLIISRSDKAFSFDMKQMHHFV